MDTLFFILFLLSLIAIPVALFKPNIVKAKSRPQALLVTVASTLVFLILFVITAPEPVEEIAEEENETEENIEIEEEVEEEAEIEEEIEETPEEEEPVEEDVQEEEIVEESETLSQQNAVAMARNYLAYTAFSKSGLIDQLKFEGFDDEDATYAVNQINVDWQEQAVKMAENYLEFTSFSRSGLIDQLVFEGFSTEDATYAVDAIGL
ncbi:Ltp family lipoprotein [Evansella cellulosilytica]|uniref:Putative host cell surface-exposed lipoprotein Ltp-like HTH region domain-containing protein n=1 Tax=Evansella cellulosilytica (strain ATCC 21833 / DSM 2522 / FERM P-1141 / JCM 9156 / N-4) TaxID=649639 RepID=E6TQG2_EVAC2|nr:Ltp family lipoprotein [Evansella cellulosilytica]ADU29340.1 protein of unknown function DUF1535 [Evansella cellulosilytica DSM 2522]